MALGIVKVCDGAIGVTCRDSGSAFRIFLPTVAAAAPSPPPETAPPPAGDIQRTVLLVDDQDMDGWETIAGLRVLQPDVRVILASGYDRTRALADAQADPPDYFLHKPYRLHELKAALDEIFAA